MNIEIKKLPTRYDELFIGGKWVTPSTDSKLSIVSPHDQSIIGSVPLAMESDIDDAVEAARRALHSSPWSTTTPTERQEIISCFITIHSKYASQFAELITRENGSPIWFSNMLQELMPLQSETILQAAKHMNWEIRQPTHSGERVVRREPAGVVAAIIPWNVPQQSALVKIVPALLAGCTVVLKPTPRTALDGLALGELFKEAGLPDGVLNIVPADRKVSEYLVSHPQVDKITFTGSTNAGRKIAGIAGSQMKRVSMELGGKAAAILLEDADIRAAVASIKFASFINNGESCLAQTRVLVPKSKYEEVVNELGNMISGLSVGDPAMPENFIGPMVNEPQFEKVREYIRLGIAEGARLVTGGTDKPGGDGLIKGWYIKPTLFADVNNQMWIAREEIFGPVLVAIPYDTVEEAIDIANDSDYGLCASVYGANKEEALDVSRQIQAGSISINGAFLDFDSPLGRYKKSGIGRESGAYGIEKFTELKAVSL